MQETRGKIAFLCVSRVSTELKRVEIHTPKASRAPGRGPQDQSTKTYFLGTGLFKVGGKGEILAGGKVVKGRSLGVSSKIATDGEK